MAIHTFVYRALFVVTLLALFAAGCSDPESNPVVPPPPLRSGTPLDVNATTITKNGSPWIVSSDWYIPAGRTVTVEAGAEIMFDGLWWVDVEGQIQAHGTAAEPIWFTSAFLDRDFGQWRGFKLRNPDPAQASQFEFCIFSYGAYFDDDTLSERGKDAQFYRGMLAIRNSSPFIERCTLVKNQNNAVFIAHDDSVAQLPMPHLRYNIMTKNDGAAVRTGPGVDLSLVDISYNCVGDNSIPAFLLSQPDSTYGYTDTVNANLDSTDRYFNLDVVPELVDVENEDYHLTSCSQCVDAGLPGTIEEDGTRFDCGIYPYFQVTGELRGVVSGSLDPSIDYRMSCHVRVPPNSTLVIPAGTKIETTGLYNLEVFGRIEIQGTQGTENEVEICACLTEGDRWGGIKFFNQDTVSAPSVVSHALLRDFNFVDVQRAGVQFTGVEFRNGFFGGAFVSTGTVDPAASVTFQDCSFDNCGSYGVHSYYSAVTVRNTSIVNIKGRGISLIGVGSAAEITNTVVQACSTSGIYMEDISSPLIVNVVLTDNSYHGLHLVNNCQPTVMNSIVYANHRYGVYAQLSSTPHLSYNNFAGNGLGDYQPTSTACTECISQNPQFVGNGDMHLGAGSPSVNAGNPDPQYNDTDGTRNDQGAYGGPGGGSVGAGIYQPNRWVVMR